MGSVDEFPAECGVMVADDRGIEVVLVVMKLPGHDLSCRLRCGWCWLMRYRWSTASRGKRGFHLPDWHTELQRYLT